MSLFRYPGRVKCWTFENTVTKKKSYFSDQMSWNKDQLLNEIPAVWIKVRTQ
jgi:hypothetical protein